MTGRRQIGDRLPRLLQVVRAGHGILLLVAPGPVAAALTGRPADRPLRRVARVLGARQLAQTAASGAEPGHAVLALGVEIDALHAASMLAVAAIAHRHRRAALIDAAAAGAFATAGVFAVRARPRDAISRTRFGRRRDRFADRVARLLVPGYPTARRDHQAVPADRIDGREDP